MEFKIKANIFEMMWRGYSHIFSIHIDMISWQLLFINFFKLSENIEASGSTSAFAFYNSVTLTSSTCDITFLYGIGATHRLFVDP